VTLTFVFSLGGTASSWRPAVDSTGRNAAAFPPPDSIYGADPSSTLEASSSLPIDLLPPPGFKPGKAAEALARALGVQSGTRPLRTQGTISTEKSAIALRHLLANPLGSAGKVVRDPSCARNTTISVARAKARRDYTLNANKVVDSAVHLLCGGSLLSCFCVSKISPNFATILLIVIQILI
jgi:hypothetical protein